MEEGEPEVNEYVTGAWNKEAEMGSVDVLEQVYTYESPIINEDSFTTPCTQESNYIRDKTKELSDVPIVNALVTRHNNKGI